MICENCGSIHNGSYASGRFCCSVCSHSYSSRLNNSTRIKNITKNSSSNPNRPKVKYNKVESHWFEYLKTNYPLLKITRQGRIYNPNIRNNNRYYRLDILVEDELNIEIDGYHPDNRDTFVRDKFLESKGILVCRVEYINPSRNAEKVNKLIEEIMDQYYPGMKISSNVDVDLSRKVSN